MNRETLIVVAGVVLIGGAVIYWVGTRFFSDEAKWERRRRRSNTPIASKGSRPSVKLSARTSKKKK